MVRGLVLFVRLASVSVLLACLVVLAGYAFHVPILTMLHPGLRAMSVVTACCLGTLASAVMAEDAGRPRLARVLASLAMAASITVAVSYVAMGEDAISRPLADHLFDYAPHLAGRTSVATCSALFLLSLALLLGPCVPVRGPTLSNVCSALTGALSGLALMGYAYGVGGLYANA